MPRVSVIIPTYNRASLCEHAVKSVLDQTYPDFEVIVADDGSTDDTSRVIGHLSDKIRYLGLDHQGRSHARNQAIALAKGEYIAFLDSDDVFLPNTLETQVEYLDRNPDYGMVYGRAICFTENAEGVFSYETGGSGWLYDKIAFYLPLTIIICSVMVRRPVLETVGGFDVRLERFEDTDMWRRISKLCKIGAIQQPLCKILSHSGNTMGDPSVELKRIKYYVRKVFKEDKHVSASFKRKGAANLFHHYGLAVWYKENRYGGPAMRFALHALRYWPFKRQYYDILLPLRFWESRLWKSRLWFLVTLPLRPRVVFYLVGGQLKLHGASLRLLVTDPKEFLRRLKKRLGILI